jgi:hypothetical protein
LQREPLLLSLLRLLAGLLLTRVSHHSDQIGKLADSHER